VEEWRGLLPNGVCEEGVQPLHLYMFEVGLRWNNMVTIQNRLCMSLLNRQSKVGPGDAGDSAATPWPAYLATVLRWWVSGWPWAAVP